MHALIINHERQGEVCLVTLEGHLDSLGAPLLDTHCGDLIKQGERRMVLDMGKTSYISSAGLRVVLVLAKKIQAAQGRLALCNLTPMVAEVIRVSGFDSFLPIKETREQAAAAVQ